MNIRNVILLIGLNKTGLINSYKLHEIVGIFRSKTSERSVARYRYTPLTPWHAVSYTERPVDVILFHIF